MPPTMQEVLIELQAFGVGDAVKYTDDVHFEYVSAHREDDGNLVVLSFDGGEEFVIAEYPAGATLETLDRVDAVRSHFLTDSEDPVGVFLSFL